MANPKHYDEEVDPRFVTCKKCGKRIMSKKRVPHCSKCNTYIQEEFQ